MFKNFNNLSQKAAKIFRGAKFTLHTFGRVVSVLANAAVVVAFLAIGVEAYGEDFRIAEDHAPVTSLWPKPKPIFCGEQSTVPCAPQSSLLDEQSAKRIDEVVTEVITATEKE